MKKLKYTHPSSCGYSPNKIYNLDKLLKELNIKMIKILFEPINFSWEELEQNNDKKNKKVENKINEATKEVDDGAED